MLRKGSSLDRRWGDILQPSDGYALRAVLPYTALRIHDVQQHVNNFIASGPKNRRTQNVFCFASTEILMKPWVSPFSTARPLGSSDVSSRVQHAQTSVFRVRHAASA